MLILSLDIHITDVFQTHSSTGTARMILFDGTAIGPVFQGRILPGGVDTQHQLSDGTGTLSARYMLEGKDAEGNAARIFIENEADLGHEDTRPRLWTDSPSLQWLEKADLKGLIISTPQKLTIEIETI